MHYIVKLRQILMNSFLGLLQLGSAKALDLTKHIGSSNSDIMKNLTLYSGIVLAVLAVLGIVYELRRYLRGNLYMQIQYSKANSPM